MSEILGMAGGALTFMGCGLSMAWSEMSDGAMKIFWAGVTSGILLSGAPLLLASLVLA